MKTALFVCDANVRCNQDIAQGLVEELQAHGPWSVLMHHAATGLKTVLKEVKPEALILHHVLQYVNEPELVKGLSIPTVQVAVDLFPNLPVPLVVPDQEEVGNMAADYLLGQSFKYFATFHYSLPHHAQRIDAFRRRIAEAHKGLADFLLKDRILGKVNHPAYINENSPLLVRWLRSITKPCAIFAYSDQPGAFLIRICQKHGLRVPEDVAVLGVDNDVLFCNTVYPNLASVHISYARIGVTAAQQILDWRPGRQILKVPPTSVIERASVRRLVLPDPLVEQALVHLRSSGEEAVQVRDLQELTGLSPQMLVYRFRQATGRTPMEEILLHRIRHAKILLAEGHVSVSEIAQKCGFNNANRFFVNFKKLVGMTPRKYREKFSI